MRSYTTAWVTHLVMRQDGERCVGDGQSVDCRHTISSDRDVERVDKLQLMIDWSPDSGGQVYVTQSRTRLDVKHNFVPSKVSGQFIVQHHLQVTLQSKY